MSKLFDRLDRISDVLGGKETQDILLENTARWEGTQISMPKWYLFIARKIRLISLMIAILITGVIFLVSRSSEYVSSDGVEAVMYLLMPILGIILLPLIAIANIQRKINFKNTLSVEQRVVYEASVKKRLKEFAVLLSVSLIVTGVIAVTIAYLYNRK